MLFQSCYLIQQSLRLSSGAEHMQVGWQPWSLQMIQSQSQVGGEPQGSAFFSLQVYI